MRKLTDHIVEGDSANHQLQIEVMDEPGAGGAHHEYLILLPPTPDAGDPSGIIHQQNAFRVSFQNGPIGEVGVNGITGEALIAIEIDRLRAFQAGPYSNRYNALALTCFENGLMWLQQRTRERIKRGVEGTHTK